MALVAKGYRVVPQKLSGGNGFRHVNLKEHKGAFKATVSGGKSDREVVFAKGKTLFVGNVDDQGEMVFWVAGRHRPNSAFVEGSSSLPPCVQQYMVQYTS